MSHGPSLVMPPNGALVPPTGKGALGIVCQAWPSQFKKPFACWPAQFLSCRRPCRTSGRYLTPIHLGTVRVASSPVMELVDVASDIVVPAMRAVFVDSEVEAFSVWRSDELEGSVALSITAQGETFEYLVVQGTVPDRTTEDWRENLRSLLVDFVAESRFGWGQNRDAP